MGGPEDPPGGPPDGTPGGEDEYRSVVFDESFVRAARLQENSARERITDHAPAVRPRPPLHRGGLPRQALLLVLLIAVAFGTAVYLGVRQPYGGLADPHRTEPPRTTVVPLAPHGQVPGAADTDTLYAHSPAARFRVGAEGIPLPPARRTSHFSEGQVVAALSTAKDYIVRSALDPDVLTGGNVRPVRLLVDTGQLDQFDQSFERPAADGRHTPTGWLVRLDPARAELADSAIRVQGSMEATEADSAALEVTADHTTVYALRPAGADPRSEASLFTVRRELHFRFDREDLRLHQAQLLVSYVQAGPLSCADDTSARLRPLLAGQTARASAPADTDPYATGSATALCGSLARSALPRL